jgi:hypothetical protein
LGRRGRGNSHGNSHGNQEEEKAHT